jgi:type II secretory pathway component GspD/PulD (secretin)
MKLVPLSILLLAALLMGAAQAETDDKIPIEIIELEHRTAAELMPHLQPLLGPRDTLTGTGHRLVVRASPGRLRQIRELVTELDRPVAGFRLSVRVEDSTQRDTRRLDPGGELDNGRGRVMRRYTTERRDTEQWVRVQDGQQALIREGEVVPMAGVVVLRPDGTLIGGVDYRTLDRGFVVTPTLAPDGRVRLHIAQVVEREDPAGGGRVTTRALETVVTVQPGEWVDLGGTAGRTRDEERAIVGTRRTRDREAAMVWVKLELEH